MPERDALRDRDHIGADHAGESTDPLRADWVLLMGHGRRALLPDPEGLGKLAYLRPLPVPHLECDRLADSGEYRECGNPLGDAVAYHNLGRDIGRPEPECGHHFRLDRRVDVRVAAYRPG